MALQLHTFPQMTVGTADRFGSGAPKAASLLVAVMMLLSLGCRRAVPAFESTSRSGGAFGTISGTVRGPAGSGSLEGRLIEVINTETSERQRLTTSNGGGFTLKVKPGKYQVQLELREGESLIKEPGVMNVSRSAADAHADFVVGHVRLSRPRPQIKQGDPGLGPPIA
jgi:hypothetical protein